MSLRYRYYFEDFPPGKVIDCGQRVLSEEEIVEFARQWDPQPFHVDREAGRRSPYGGLIASAWHTGCVMMRMACDAYLNDSSSVGSPGVEDWRFLVPVRAGDALRGRVTVLEARASSSRPELGIVKNLWQLINQRDEVVVSLIGTQFYLRRAQ